jgi:ketosteroid isomerase-like protein
MSQETTNKRVVTEFLDAMSRGDMAAILDAYAEDGFVHTMGSTPISGKYDKEQIRGFASGIYDAFPQGLQFTIRGMTAEGERVAVEAESNGAHISGQNYNNFYHFLFILRDGKVTSLTEYLDTQLVLDVLMAPPA